MSKEFKAVIVSNLFWFAASLVIALMIWFVAIIEANPIDQRVFNRPINLNYDPNMIITSVSSETARVVVSAQESTLTILQPDDITVTADLIGFTAGTYTVALDVNISRQASGDTQPTQVTVTIENISNQQVPVEVDVIPPPINYADEAPERDVFQAVVSGANANVSRVSRVVAEFDLSGQTNPANVERTLTLVAEDGDGNPVNDVTIEPASIPISVNVIQRGDVRTFTVRPDIDFNSLPENFEFRDVDYEPNTVIINGSPDVLASLGDTIDTVPISLENRTGNFSIDVALDLPNDANLIILSDSNTIAVDIFINEQDATLPLENIPVRIIGESENSDRIITVNPLTISGVLSGPISLIETISEDDVQAIVDINGLDEGTFTIAPQIDISNGQISLDSFEITLIPADVNITISIPQPDAEVSPEATVVPEVTATATQAE